MLLHLGAGKFGSGLGKALSDRDECIQQVGGEMGAAAAAPDLERVR
jgi:hypothetical protein